MLMISPIALPKISNALLATESIFSQSASSALFDYSVALYLTVRSPLLSDLKKNSVQYGIFVFR
jgi:hypothetical protein